jgi:CxxC motif-containing protein
MAMLIPIKINNSIDIQDIEITNTNFKNLNLKEEHIEEFLRSNIEVIFQDETLLVVGKQVVNKENGRSDLTAVDQNGNLVLIEIKRDVEDIKQRREAFEFQAIRYAASYAKIKTSDELVDKIFASYIEKYKGEFELGELTAYEKATRILNDFLEKNNAAKTFNSKQRIILIASSFDSQTLSAVAWLIANNVDISCFELSPMKISDNYFIDINRILPPPALEDFYVEVDNKKRPVYSEKRNTPITRSYLPRMDKLFEWGIIKAGDMVVIKNFDNSEAAVIDTKNVEYNGQKLSFNQWGEKVTGWSALSVYEWTIVKGSEKTLHEIRKEKLLSVENEIE